MNHLPFEILKEIFILLPQHQKLECMCVCRSWEKVIKDTCLFHTVLITTPRNLNKLIQVFECTPSKGAHVKRLILYISHQYSSLIKSFLAFFPNLKSFYYYGLTDAYISMITKSWTNDRLKALEDKPPARVSHHLLISNMFSHLKILDLNLNHDFTTSFSPLLINAPNLIHLTLTKYQFIYNEVEQFDQVYPLLETFKFELIYPFDGNVPDEIKPNTRINYVHFTLNCISMVDQSILLGYINKKYTNLAGFVYDSGVPSCNPSLLKENEITNYGKLHHALLSLIAAQGPQFKTLKVLCNRFVFSRLVNSIMPFQLDKLNLDMALTFSGSLHIKHTFLNSPFRQLHTLIVQFLTTSNFEWLKSLDKLAVLKIKCPRFQVVKIDSVMQHASKTLKTLVIKGCSVGFEQDECALSSSEKPTFDQDQIPNETTPICSLRKIEMANVNILENVDNFISISCPGLKVLSVYKCSIDSTKLRVFQLPHMHLLYFNITKSYNFYDPSGEKNWNYTRDHTKNNNQFYRIDRSQYVHYKKKSFGSREYPVVSNSSLLQPVTHSVLIFIILPLLLLSMLESLIHQNDWIACCFHST